MKKQMIKVFLDGFFGMKDKIEQLRDKVASLDLKSKQDLEDYKRFIIGKNGELTALFDAFKLLPGDAKREVGSLLNQLKQFAQERFDMASENMQENTGRQLFDYSLPGADISFFNGHPLELVRQEINGIFQRIGFSVATGPEVEHEWYNFSALNFPDDHPARDMQDTFFVKDFPGYVLRTHTSPVQVRTMIESQPPVRIISPGRVYRCDSDATHSPVFHQVEGLYIDKQVSFADLKEVLYYFVQAFFGASLKVRFRPSYFPFTEPSAEMDIAWTVNGKEKWMEILGCGMVDPQVLKFANLDPEVYSGYAFGVGVERMAMLRYQIKDIRSFYENDKRFLSQF